MDNSGHQVGVLTWLVLHVTHSELWSREGLAVNSHQKPSPLSTPSKDISPPRKYSSCGSREGEKPRSSSNGWLQLDMSSVVKVEGRNSSTAVSLPGLHSKDNSSNVTHHLILAGLGDLDCLIGPSWWDSAWGACNVWPADWDLHLQFLDFLWLPDCLQLPDCQWLTDWLRHSMFSSNKAVTANACQWVSFTTARAI